MGPSPKWLSVRTMGDNVAELLSLIPPDLIEGTVEVSSSESDVFVRDEKLTPFLEWLSASGLKSLSPKEIEVENWVTSCMSVLEPIKIGSLEVIPFEGPAKVKLERNEIGIIAGLGFGTGHHESTKIALSLLQRSEVLSAKPERILDVGTGSGILAIASEKLFSSPVAAIDNDPLALINANDNLELNGSSFVKLAVSTIDSIEGVFDLITANIYAEVLAELSPVFHELLSNKQEAFLILSGIERSRLCLVDNSVSDTSAFSRSIWSHITTMSEGNWCGILYKKALNK